jgi:hypothetical protein
VAAPLCDRVGDMPDKPKKQIVSRFTIFVEGFGLAEAVA